MRRPHNKHSLMNVVPHRERESVCGYQTLLTFDEPRLLHIPKEREMTSEKVGASVPCLQGSFTCQSEPIIITLKQRG